MECKNGDDSFGCFSESCDAADADGGVGGVALKTVTKTIIYFLELLFPSNYHNSLTENNKDNQHRCESSY